MPSHITILQDGCTLLLMYLYSIRAKEAAMSFLDSVASLPFLVKGYDKEELYSKYQTKKLLVDLLRVKTRNKSPEKIRLTLAGMYNEGLLARAAPFLRPDIRDLLLETIKEIVGGKFNEVPCTEVELFDIDPPSCLHLGVFKNKHRPRFPIFQRPSYPVVEDVRNPSYFRESTVLVGHKSPVFCLTYDRNGDRIITGSDDYLIKVWDVSTGYLIFTLNGHGQKISDFYLFEDGRHLVSCDVEGFVVIWDIAKGVVVDKRRISTLGITSVFFTPARYESHTSVFATGEDGNTYFLNLKPNFMFEQFHSTNEGLIYKDKKILAGCTNRSGTLIGYGGEDFMIHILMPKLLSTTESINAVIRSSGDCSGDCSGGYLDWEAPQVKFILHGHTFAVASLDFNSDGTRLLSSSQDNSARVWTYNPELNQWTCVIMGEDLDLDEDDGVVRHLQKNHKIRKEMPMGLENAVCSVAWAWNDDFVIVSYDSGHMKVFCSHSGKMLFKCLWFDSPIHVIQAHPKHSNWVLSACYSGNVILWDCLTGNWIKKWQFPDVMFLQGHFSPKGDNFCLSASNGQCLTFLHTFDSNYQPPIISGQEQAFSHDFVNVPPNVSFPINGTETRRNEFQSYELRNFNCDKYPVELQQPDDFGKQYALTNVGGQLNDPKTVCTRIEQYKWKTLDIEVELPKKFQYQKYRREHMNLFIDRTNMDFLALEPLILPPSPKDDDYIESSHHNSEESSERSSEEHSSADSDSGSGSDSSRKKRKPTTRLAKRRAKARKHSLNSRPAYSFRSRSSPMKQADDLDSDNESSEGEASREMIDITLNLDSYPLDDGFTTDRVWASIIDQHTSNYFPQPNDIVFYFRSGHQEYIDSVDDATRAALEAFNKPFCKYPNLSFIEEGVISSVRFVMLDNQPLVKITIKFSASRSSTLAIGRCFPRFIAFQPIFVAATQVSYGCGDQVRILSSDEIKTVASISDSEDPWNKFRLDDGNSYGVWELDSLCRDSPTTLSSLDPAKTQAHISTIQHLVQTPEFDLFVDQISFVDYPAYLDVVCCPMFLSLIWLRLTKGYYRSEAAVSDDINLIASNCRAFNESGSAVTIQARELKKEFKFTLKHVSDQMAATKESNLIPESDLDLSRSKAESAPPSPVHNSEFKSSTTVEPSDDEFIPIPETLKESDKEVSDLEISDVESPILFKDESDEYSSPAKKSKKILTKRKVGRPRKCHSSSTHSKTKPKLIVSDSSEGYTPQATGLRPRKRVNYSLKLDIGTSSEELDSPPLFECSSPVVKKRSRRKKIDTDDD